MLITFDPFIRCWQTRHHWNPWAKPSSTHPMTSFYVRIDFPPSWFMSKTLWFIEIKFDGMLGGSFPSAGKKSGVIWCLGGAIINKIAFLLISLFIQKSPFQDTPESSSVRRDLAWEPEGQRFESGGDFGGDFDVSFYIYLGNRLMYLLCHWSPH